MKLIRFHFSEFCSEFDHPNSVEVDDAYNVWTHLIRYSQWTDEKDEEEFDLVHLDTADAAAAAAAAAAADDAAVAAADADATVTFPAKIETGH